MLFLRLKRFSMKGVWIFCVSLIGLTACKGKSDDNAIDTYDRQTMLANVCDGYIVPAYSNYHQKTSDLLTAVQNFIASPDLINLTACRNSWKTAALAWQEVAMLEFGPAESISLRSQTNLYPVDTSLVQTNISTGSYDLQQAVNFDAKGFQALDYLLYRPGFSDADLVGYYSSNTNAKTYLVNITSEIKTNAESVYSQWSSSYSGTFKGSYDSNALGSSVSNMANAFSLHYETYVRKGKIGVPLGVFNGVSQQIMPEHVEAYFSGYSVEFAIRSMQSIQKLFHGRNYSTGAEGQGLDDYLLHVEAKNGSEDLSVSINNKIDQIVTGLNGLSGSLSNNIVSNFSGVNAIYQNMQQLVPLIKVDMTAALGILISYQDADGD